MALFSLHACCRPSSNGAATVGRLTFRVPIDPMTVIAPNAARPSLADNPFNKHRAEKAASSDIPHACVRHRYTRIYHFAPGDVSLPRLRLFLPKVAGVLMPPAIVAACSTVLRAACNRGL
jgi:hypothetical protein